MELKVNGETHVVADNLTVAGLVESLGLGLGYVVVELNGEVVVRSAAAATPLTSGDTVELVRAVAGG